MGSRADLPVAGRRASCRSGDGRQATHDVWMPEAATRQPRAEARDTIAIERPAKARWTRAPTRLLSAQAPDLHHRAMAPPGNLLSLPPKWLHRYDDFVTKNASQVSQIESALRSLTYIIPGTSCLPPTLPFAPPF